MKTRKVDRTGWPSGPWDIEEDEKHWVYESGLHGLILRCSGQGHLCGYVGLPKGHPWYGLHYSDIPLTRGVHGELTYAGCGLRGVPRYLWWVGFDCGHSFDFMPGLSLLSGSDHSAYCTMNYVERHVHEMVRGAEKAWPLIMRLACAGREE